MSVDSDALVDAGERALDAGEWSAARSSFEAAHELEETAEALRGLGNALWWLDDAEASLRYREWAYAAFRHRPDPHELRESGRAQGGTLALTIDCPDQPWRGRRFPGARGSSPPVGVLCGE